MATRPKAVIESRNGEKFSPITITKNVLTDDGRNLHDILSDRKEDMMTPTIENSSSMFKVGQGDNVDYSSNVVNGAYESMVLKGKTMVNCIQEPSSQDVVLPYEFEEGRYVTINDTKESGALGVELKGQTLVNLVGEKREYNNANLYGWEFMLPYKLTKNARYMVVFNVSGTITDNSKVYLMDNGFNSNSGNTPYPVSFTLGYNKHITTASGDNHKVLRIRTGSQAVNDFKVSDVMLIPYQEGMENWDIPYFTGMKSVEAPSIKTTGKNLFDRNNANIFIGYSSGDMCVSNNNMRSLIFNVKEGCTYTIQKTNESSRFAIDCTIEEPKNAMKVKRLFNVNTATEATVTIPIGYNYIVIYYANSDVGDNLDIMPITQIEESSTATTYEPYKSSILSLPEEVVLRSLPNGVCDTFNTRTGVYTQRIKEVVLNGTDPITSLITSASEVLETTSRCYLDYASIPSDIRMKPFPSANGVSNKLICDMLPVKAVVPNMQQDDIESLGQTTAGFSIRLKGKNIAECKQRLAEQPITIQYELATPIITKINLSSTLKSWNTTTHIYSEIPENTLYPILTHSNPTYPVILKPSTKYSIVVDSYSNKHSNSAINFNLGGATASTIVGNRVTTITTPSTLSNELLTMSGRGNKLNNVMVIKEDVVGDEPYFEGICDCKSPILSNVGKNLFDGLSYIDGFVASGNDYTVSYDADVTSILVNVNKNTDYILSAKTNFDRSLVGGSLEPISIGTKTTNLNAERVSNTIKFNSGEYTNIIIYLNSSKIDIEDIQVEEGSVSTTYEPYKFNILSCNGDKIELMEDMFEQGSLFYDNNTFEQAKSFANNDTGTRSVRIRTKKLIKVKPNTTYRFSYKNSCQSWFYGYDMNENPTNCKSAIVGVTEQVFTTNSSTHYIALVLFKTGNPTITPSNYDYKSIQIAEVDKTIVLRSLPNGVCDTLNVETGEYVQRIGETVLDGSDDENWGINNTEGTTTNRFISQSLQNSNVDQSTGVGQFLCDKLKTEVWNQTSRLGLTINGRDVFIYNASIDYSASAIKQWLSQNPVTIQYELKTPIVKTINLSGYPFSYEKGHAILSSGSIEQSLTPKVEYSVVTNRNGQIRSNQKMVERHQKQLDRLQAMILTNLVNTQYEQTLTNLKYDLKNVREEVK